MAKKTDCQVNVGVHSRQSAIAIIDVNLQNSLKQLLQKSPALQRRSFVQN